MTLLRDVQFTQLDATCYCATATLELRSCALVTKTQLDCALKRQNQRQGVRLLLQKLLAELAIVDTLDELAFPYTLRDHGYYVCFSHSANKVAVAISDRQAIGLDVEVNEVAWQVAQRYYHPSEIALLERLPLAKRDYLVRLLWQIKESFIKINQDKLTAGLARDYPKFMRQLLANDTVANSLLESPWTEPTDQPTSDYQLAILEKQQTVIVF